MRDIALKRPRWMITACVLIPLVTSGCFNYEQETFLNPDMSGRIVVHVYPNPEPMKSKLISLADNKDSAGGNTVTAIADALAKAKIRLDIKEEEFLKTLDAGAIRNKEYRKVDENGIVHTYFIVTFSDIRKLYIDRERIRITRDGGGLLHYRERIETSPKEMKTTPDKSQMDLFEGCHFKYTLHMPGKIVEANTSELAGNVAVWTIPFGSFFKRGEFIVSAAAKK